MPGVKGFLALHTQADGHREVHEPTRGLRNTKREASALAARIAPNSIKNGHISRAPADDEATHNTTQSNAFQNRQANTESIEKGDTRPNVFDTDFEESESAITISSIAMQVQDSQPLNASYPFQIDNNHQHYGENGRVEPEDRIAKDIGGFRRDRTRWSRNELEGNRTYGVSGVTAERNDRQVSDETVGVDFQGHVGAISDLGEGEGDRYSSEPLSSLHEGEVYYYEDEHGREILEEPVHDSPRLTHPEQVSRNALPLSSADKSNTNRGLDIKLVSRGKAEDDRNYHPRQPQPSLVNPSSIRSHEPPRKGLKWVDNVTNARTQVLPGISSPLEPQNSGLSSSCEEGGQDETRAKSVQRTGKPSIKRNNSSHKSFKRKLASPEPNDRPTSDAEFDESSLGERDVTPKADNLLTTSKASPPAGLGACAPDYALEKLYKLPYNDLLVQPFDEVPTPIVSILGRDDDKKALDKQLELVASRSPKDQRRFCSSLSTREWEESGDWFMDQFSDIITRMKIARQKKRKINEIFEKEISDRQEKVQRRIDGTETKLTEMKEKARGLLPKVD